MSFKIIVEKVGNGFIISTDEEVPQMLVFEDDDSMPPGTEDIPSFINMCRMLAEHFGVYNNKHNGVFLKIDWEREETDES